MIPKEVKVADHPDLVKRDGVIVNKDEDGFKNFTAARRAALEKQSQVQTLTEKVAGLENTMQSMAMMLQKILENQNETKQIT